MISEFEEHDPRKKRYVDFKFIKEQDLKPYVTYKFQIMDRIIIRWDMSVVLIFKETGIDNIHFAYWFRPFGDYLPLNEPEPNYELDVYPLGYMSCKIFSFKYRISDVKKNMFITLRREHDGVKILDFYF
jgi:hypothetical protein